MRYFYCLVDKEQGMKSCGAPDSSTYILDAETANRSVSMRNIKRSKGNTCYFQIQTDSTWNQSVSNLMIYPSKKSGVRVLFANGTSRSSALSNSRAVNEGESIAFLTGQQLFVIVVPEGDDNQFEFKYSVK